MKNQQLTIWQQPKIITWSKILTNSFERLLGRKLIADHTNPETISQTLFFAPFVVVSHGTEDDPILNYGNQTALQLWETNWQNLTQMPSRLTAEPINRETRAKMLEQAATKGYIDNYQGVRISSTGKRFAIQQAIVWNLTNEEGKYCGQAATFSHWSLLET
jgi:hypothetical protein